MAFLEKVMDEDTLIKWCQKCRAGGRKIVATNGCFDILHIGHATYLEAAKAQGDALVVGVNGDESVRAIKGAGRPINNERARAALVAALESVDAVFIFKETDAMRFLSIVKPDVYVKGGDYNIDTINQPERRLVEQFGGKVLVLAGVPGVSTTEILKKISPSPP
ncbi:MAG: adenylyltransferase/cytidyltransferase family protein [Verrucomicrobiae bacterium]|nr:adenylyltransferase/cytidyltransferase family protein [Verrucomicrobiae bacterium]